jgi:hypothetical protein
MFDIARDYDEHAGLRAALRKTAAGNATRWL